MEDKEYIYFEKWFNSQETRFHQGAFSDKEIGYSSFLEGVKYTSCQNAALTNAMHSDGEGQCTCRHPGNMRNLNCPVHQGS